MDSKNKMTVAKEKIILSAESLFGKQGFESTSVNAIIAHAKVSKGAFYHHFKTKEDLILAIIDFESQKNQVVPNQITNSQTPEDKFISEISRWFQSLEDTKHLLPWMIPLMAHPVMKTKFQQMEPEGQKVREYLKLLLSDIKVADPTTEAEILFYYFGGLKMELSVYPKTDLSKHKDLILNKYIQKKLS